MTKDNKDYIINIRVSKETYEKIKDRAQENRETVSNLVRKVIDDSSEIISDISNDMFGKNKIGKMSVYYKGLAADNIACSVCDKKIKKGASVTIGETKTGKKYYFCNKCK